MKIGILQYDVKWLDVSANFDKIRLLLSTSTHDYDVIFLPEMFNTGYVMSPNKSLDGQEVETLHLLQSLASEHNTVFAGSIPYKTLHSYTNRMCFVNAKGLIDHYDKIHLFTPAGEAKEYKAGNQVKDFKVGDTSIRSLVCYDLRFPYAGYNTTDYDVIAYAANWPVARIEQWKILLAARAIENQSFSIGVNRVGKDSNGYDYNGQSRVVDFLGNVMLDCGDQEGIFSTDLDLKSMYAYRSKLPFLNDQKTLNH